MMDFIEPNWNLPLDTAARLAGIPEGSEVKGLMFQTALREAEARSGKRPGRGNYSPLSNYPLPELLEVLVESAALAHPDVPPKEGLRRLGQKVFPALRENVAGRLLFSVAGHDLAAAIRLVGKAYRLFGSSDARVTEEGDNYAVVTLDEVWTFPDAYHFGVFEGALAYYHKDGTVRTRAKGLRGAEMKLAWKS